MENINYRESRNTNNSDSAPVEKRRGRRGGGGIMISLFILLFLGSVATAGYFYWQWDKLKNNPASVAEDENKNLINKVGRLILLPDETPTIATVTDPSKLSDQTFFANAETGYKVLVYSVAKKAILYDPGRNMIIEVGPVNITDEAEIPSVETELDAVSPN